MAEPTIDLNSQLIAKGLNPSNPANTYVDFANQLANNQLSHQQMEQAVARAKEMTTQAQLETESKKEADAAGYNSELINTMTPAEAVAYLKIILQEKGLSIDESAIDEWAKTLPRVINRQEVEAFASRFARETTRSGQPAAFTTDEKVLVPAGSSAADIGLEYFGGQDSSEASDGTQYAHVPNNGMYQVVYNNQGDIVKFIPGGKEPVDQTAKENTKKEQATAKQWQKLDAAINLFIKQGRGNQLAIAITRSNRALNELADNETLVPQVLSYIGKDLSGIFQGGVPPQSGMEDEDFRTAYQKLNQFIQKYTGVQGFFKTDVGNQRAYLIRLVTRLRDSSLEMMERLIKSEYAAYKEIIDADPERWDKMVNDKVGANTSGLTATAQAATGAAAAPTTPQVVPGVKPSVGQSGKVVPKYTIEE